MDDLEAELQHTLAAARPVPQSFGVQLRVGRALRRQRLQRRAVKAIAASGLAGLAGIGIWGLESNARSLAVMLQAEAREELWWALLVIAGAILLTALASMIGFVFRAGERAWPPDGWPERHR